MSAQRTIAKKISSFATPTGEDIALFEGLAPSGQQALLRAEIAKGFDGVSEQTVEQVIAELRAARPKTDE